MKSLADIQIGLTEHLEGPADASTAAILAEATRLVLTADELGVRYAWFAEHHAHVHRGHLPTPLLFALHLAAKTRQIALGTAVICLNLHDAIDVAEQVAVADVLTAGRIAAGFGSGSTPAEAALFGVAESNEAGRHEAFANALDTIARWWSRGDAHPPQAQHRLPLATADLAGRCWCAVNSVGAARVAGERNFNVLFSHLRTPVQYREYTDAYRSAGGRRLIAANRPLVIGENDAHAADLAIDAVRTLWRLFRAEGKIPAATAEPQSLAALTAHPLNFIVGGPDSVVAQIAELHHHSPFDVLNVEVSWADLPAGTPGQTLERLMHDVLPRLSRNASDRPHMLVRAPIGPIEARHRGTSIHP